MEYTLCMNGSLSVFGCSLICVGQTSTVDLLEVSRNSKDHVEEKTKIALLDNAKTTSTTKWRQEEEKKKQRHTNGEADKS